MPDDTPQAALIAVPLDTYLVGSRVVTFDQVPSTNDLALRSGEDGTVFVADCQTAGRGRHGRPWHSAPGLGLWFSVALDGRDDGIGFGAALAVRDALSPYCPVEIKWPNDLLSGGRKLCGILVEHRRSRTAVGIGINVLHRPADFPKALRGTATSVAMETEQTVERGSLLRAVLKQLDKRVMLLRQGGYEDIRQEWADACGLIGRRVRCDAVEGTVAGFDAHGALLVNTAEGRRRLLSGELAVVDGA